MRHQVANHVSAIRMAAHSNAASLCHATPLHLLHGHHSCCWSAVLEQPCSQDTAVLLDKLQTTTHCHRCVHGR